MLISIVIPVYNAAGYIENSMDKLFSLHLGDCEVVIVDDGSTDDSGLICERLTQGRNVKLIHQQNKGPGAARNTGIKNSAGEYILFLDSDDYLLQGGLDEIISIIKTQKPDIIMGKFLLLDSREKVIYSPNYYFDKVKNADEARGVVAKLPDSIWNVFRYICRREYLNSNKLLFNETIRLGEDLDFSLRILDKAASIAFAEAPHYTYCHGRAGSLTNAFSFQNTLGLNRILAENLAAHEGNLAIQQRLIRDSFYSLSDYCRMSKDEKISFRAELDKTISYYPMSSSAVVKMFVKTSKLLPLWSIVLLTAKQIRRKVRGF